MAAKPSQAQTQSQPGGGGGEKLTMQIAGLSKKQLHGIMSQMKTLIEQNPQQARHILIENPSLTKSLFQAQIMLGMVQPPKVMPNIQQASVQQSQAPSQLGQVNAQASQPSTNQAGSHGAYVTKPQVQVGHQQQSQPSLGSSSVPIPPLSSQSQTSLLPVPSIQQGKGTFSAQVSPQITSHVPNPPSLPSPALQHSISSVHMPITSSQSQPALLSSSFMLPPLQPPLPQQPRPTSVQSFQQNLHPQVPPGIGFQLPGAQRQLSAQSVFHPGISPPTSLSQGQPPMPSQPPPQQLYQGPSHVASDIGSAAQVDRGQSWAPGLADRATTGTQLPAPPPLLMTSQMASTAGGLPVRTPQLTPEMEQALLQQVMSLTPEQISQLPPEHRNQVFQIQQMYRR